MRLKTHFSSRHEIGGYRAMNGFTFDINIVSARLRGDVEGGGWIKE